MCIHHLVLESVESDHFRNADVRGYYYITYNINIFSGIVYIISRNLITFYFREECEYASRFPFLFMLYEAELNTKS
jgi:hypothetical protein